MTLIPYQINEAELMIPAHWIDNSINIFRIPANDKAKEASLVFSRDASQGDASFAEFVLKQIKECEAKLPHFKLLKHNNFQEPMSYAWVDYQWQAEQKTVMLRQIFLEGKPVNLIVTLTTTPLDAPGHEATWLEVIRHIKLHDPVLPLKQAQVF